jgi:hypothetical protein
MVTSRPVPQQTAQIVSPLAGQNRAPLRFSQMGQIKNPPIGMLEKQNTRGPGKKPKPQGAVSDGRLTTLGYVLMLYGGTVIVLSFPGLLPLGLFVSYQQRKKHVAWINRGTHGKK